VSENYHIKPSNTVFSMPSQAISLIATNVDVSHASGYESLWPLSLAISLEGEQQVHCCAVAWFMVMLDIHSIIM
jgi:hypothetical protein